MCKFYILSFGDSVDSTIKIVIKFIVFRSDATCIICREEMATAKKLLDGHLFHVHCLRSWLEHQHTCPTCRAPIIPAAWDLSIFLVVNHDHCISTEKQENRLKKRFLYGFSMGASAPQEGFSLLGRCRAACPNVQGQILKC
jgi:hypothetical protein